MQIEIGIDGEPVTGGVLGREISKEIRFRVRARRDLLRPDTAMDYDLKDVELLLLDEPVVGHDPIRWSPTSRDDAQIGASMREWARASRLKCAHAAAPDRHPGYNGAVR